MMPYIGDRCPATVVGRDGYEDACDLPAANVGRFYEDEWDEVGFLEAACDRHAALSPPGVTRPLLELLARRPELRDVGIAGYLAAEVLGNVGPNPRMPSATREPGRVISASGIWVSGVWVWAA